MSKRKKSGKRLRDAQEVKGLLDDSIECPECKVKGKCYLVGGFHFSFDGVSGAEWGYLCKGCGAKFNIVERSVDDEGVNLD